MAKGGKWLYLLLFKKRRVVATGLMCLGVGMLLVVFLPVWVWICCVSIALIVYAYSYWLK
jgi:4-hydroxybenzoate polyprenyltransferase